MSENEYKEFQELLEKYKNDPLVQSMRKYRQHGGTNTYDHSMNVARKCYLIDKYMRRYLGIESDKELLMETACLHDFCLYDWHDKSDPSHKLHGFTHAKRAAANAKKYFGVTDKAEDIIEGHMWPLNISKVPRSREAAILVVADKYCAVEEVVNSAADVARDAVNSAAEAVEDAVNAAAVAIEDAVNSATGAIEDAAKTAAFKAKKIARRQ